MAATHRCNIQNKMNKNTSKHTLVALTSIVDDEFEVMPNAVYYAVRQLRFYVDLDAQSSQQLR